MPVISKEKVLVAEVEKARLDDFVEVYNELFPEEPTSEGEAGHQLATVRAKILQHMKNEMETEEIIDLGKVVFPLNHDFWLDEEEEKFHHERNEKAVEVE